jgi:hypothetical protein
MSRWCVCYISVRLGQPLREERLPQVTVFQSCPEGSFEWG